MINNHCYHKSKAPENSQNNHSKEADHKTLD